MNSDEPQRQIAFTVGNDTRRPVKLWFEPFCNEAEVPRAHMVSFRASLMGDADGPQSELSAAFEKISDKVRGGSVGPELEINIAENQDGEIYLELWLDETDEVGFHDPETGRYDLIPRPKAGPAHRRKIQRALFGDVSSQHSARSDGEGEMTRKRISTGSPFEEKFAYSRAVAQGDWCFCAGTTGFDYATMTMPEGPAEQTRNIFETIRKALEEAGFTLADIVRLQVTVTDPAHWEAAAPVVRHYLADIRPANTTVVSALMTPEMKIEIEATAYRGG